MDFDRFAFQGGPPSLGSLWPVEGPKTKRDLAGATSATDEDEPRVMTAGSRMALSQLCRSDRRQ